MAQAVKETPVLRGKDAERFAKKIKANASLKVPAHEYKRAIVAYERVKVSK
jgi:hypothetical protein